MLPDTPSPTLSPFLIEPRFVARVWGSRDLRPWYDHEAGDDPIGEVWLTGDECLVQTGDHKGKSLAALFSEEPAALLGTDSAGTGSPLLIKMIFAREKLSVQVHPDDRLAHKYGHPRGKTECWYALAAEPGAEVAVGIKPGVGLDQIRTGIEDCTLEKSLNLLPVAEGDMFFVDAGTVHAIWPGSILLETQQNCDLTYRMYDYGRPRELHIDKSLEATRLTTRAGKVPAQPLADRNVLINVEYFRVERLLVDGQRISASLPGEGEAAPGLSYLFAAAGSARIKSDSFESITLPARGIVCVPATTPAFTIEDLNGDLDLIRITPRSGPST